MRIMTLQPENDYMASPGQLVRVLAAALGVPEATLAQHDRNLVVAGLRSKRGRGWAAAHVTARDLAHLLTAVLGSEHVKDSVASVERYADTRPYAPRSSERLFTQTGIDELAKLPANHSFIDALEALLVAASTGSLAKALEARAARLKADKLSIAPQIKVAALTPGTSAEIRITGLRKGITASVTYVQPSPWDRPGAKQAGKRAVWEQRTKRKRMATDLEQYRQVSQKTILVAAGALTQDKEEK